MDIIIIDDRAFGASFECNRRPVWQTCSARSVLQDQLLKKQSEPALIPISGARPSSKFGNRIDLFSGELGFHASVDFIPHTGTDVIAAASGVVLAAQFHPQYGNVTDPGNGLSTRSGHASVLAAKAGDIV